MSPARAGVQRTVGGSLEDRLQAVIAGLYEAALDQALWQESLLQIANLTRSGGTHLVVLDRTLTRSVSSLIARFPSEADEEYMRVYAFMDQRTRRLATVGNLTVISESEVLSEEIRRRCPIHQEFLVKWAATRTLACSFPLESGNRGFLGVLRAETHGPYGAEERSALERVFPHVRQALRIGERIAVLEADRQAASACFERLEYGVVLFGERAQPLLMNNAAAQILSAGDGLSVGSSGLAASERTANRQLSILLTTVARSELTFGEPAEYVAVPRPSRHRPYQVLIVPLPRSSVLAGEVPAARAAAFIVDPEKSPVAPDEALRVFYGLTPAEARLASDLRSGLSLESHAERAGVTIATARSQLKVVFAKTGTHRQGELVALLSRLPALSATR